MQRTPAPIFNHRKRPRQAMLSHPQNLDNTGTTRNEMSSSVYSGLMPIGGFSDSSKQTNCCKKETGQNTKNDGHYTRYGRQSAMPYGTNMESIKKRSGSTDKNSCVIKKQERNGQSYIHQNESLASKDILPTRTQHNFFGANSSVNLKQNSFQGQQASKSGSFQQRRFNAGRENFQMSGAGDSSRLSLSRLSNNGTVYGTGNVVGCHGDTGQKEINTPRADAGVTPSKGENRTRKPAAKKEDSLHFITTTVQGVKHWTNFRDHINMIFEVFGILDSALLRTSDGMGKVFQLRDEKGSMQCVFYEIDRTLPRLIRGHWHRCVGMYEKQLDTYKCVSVRPATSEERKQSHVDVKMCESTLINLTKDISEQ